MSKQTLRTIGDDFPKEQARLRELLVGYREIGPVGRFGAMLIEEVLKRADHAVMAGDVVAMIRLYKEMQGFE